MFASMIGTPVHEWFEARKVNSRVRLTCDRERSVERFGLMSTSL